ncbi:MAG: ABC transporter ATP-binding protein, partial [Chloroflexi bacterium]|nr:ABC transporter ATP-binding protein [Chloroflexota bacterium]
HYMEEAAQLCDRLVLMHQGQILAEGTPDQVIASYAGREVAELHLDPPQRAAMKALLAGAPVEIEDAEEALYVFSRDGVALRDLLPTSDIQPQVRAGTLEDVFLRLTGRRLVE